jgi:histidinol-phosphate aminotransferase
MTLAAGRDSPGTKHGPARPGVDDPLRFHGDAEVEPGMIDAAVNVRLTAPPPWLRAVLAASLDDLARYPDQRRARAAVARRHGRDVSQVLLTAGAAEAFVLIARALRPRLAAVVHPSFTEPEAALRAAGQPVERVVLDVATGFALDPTRVPERADLVVLGNPTNPTSVLHPAARIAALARPGRVLVVDEAFADAVPGERDSLTSAAGDLPGLVVVRSLTKTWALAGLRVGYLLADPQTVDLLGRAQPAWAVSTPALAAAEACCAPAAVAEADRGAVALVGRRDRFAGLLAALPGVAVVPGAAAPFLLTRVSGGAAVRAALRAAGIAVRRGDTFPGLGPDWLRVTVRDDATNEHVAQAFARALAQGSAGR